MELPETTPPMTSPARSAPQKLAYVVPVPVSVSPLCVSASEPATDTEPAAPEIASLEAPTPPLAASTTNDTAVTGPAASDASLATSARVIATPPPIAAEPPVAEPSAFEPAAAVSDDFTVRAPPTETAPPLTIAFAEALAIVTATAAATDTGPPEVDADGVELPPDPEPPFPDERPPALLRSPAT